MMTGMASANVALFIVYVISDALVSRLQSRSSNVRLAVGCPRTRMDSVGVEMLAFEGLAATFC